MEKHGDHAGKVLVCEPYRKLVYTWNPADRPEVAARRDDPARHSVASMKSLILEALAAYGFADLIRPADIEVQSGIFMKRQSAQMRRR